MNDLPLWRRTIFFLTATFVIIMPFFFIGFVSSMNLFPSWKPPESYWERMMLVGYYGAWLAIVGGLFGRSWPRIAVSIAAVFEIFFWWFMSIGL